MFLKPIPNFIHSIPDQVLIILFRVIPCCFCLSPQFFSIFISLFLSNQCHFFYQDLFQHHQQNYSILVNYICILYSILIDSISLKCSIYLLIIFLPDLSNIYWVVPQTNLSIVFKISCSQSHFLLGMILAHFISIL